MKKLSVGNKYFRIILPFFLAFFLSCNYYPNSAKVSDGKLLLPEDWSGNALYLKGEWHALPGIRAYEDFLDYPDEIFNIPIPSSGRVFSGNDYRKTVTLLLHVELPYDAKIFEVMSIMTRKVWTAHKVFINGHLILENGVVSEDKNIHYPRVKPKVGVFPYLKSLDIVIQISNFTFVEQGMIEAPIFGDSHSVFSLLYAKKFYDMIIILVLILFILVNLGIYLSNTRDKGPLLYSILLLNTIFLTQFSSSTDRLILDIFPSLSYYYVVRFEMVFVSLMVPFYLTFLRYIFPQEMNEKFYKTYIIVRLFAMFVSIPFLDFMFQSMIFFILVDIAITFYSYWILFLAVRRERPQAKVILFGFTVVTLCLVNDATVELGFTNSIHASLYGIVIMFLFHSSALVFRLRTTHLLNEEYSIQLEKSKEELELRVEERTRAYRDAMDQVKDTNKLKDRFLSIVSHDIRSPLTGVSSSMGLILNDEELEDKDRMQIIKNSKKSVDGLILMTSEILNYAKNQAIRIMPTFEQIRLSDLITKNTAKLAGLVLEKKLIIHQIGNPNLVITTDPNLFGIVITNIFSNAIKFTQLGGSITFEFLELQDSIRLIIRDNGLGIVNERLNSIFDYDLNYSTQGTKGETGTGFGLPFSKEILDALNNPITIQSKLELGTEFEITIPKKVLNILIVDDNPNFREKMKNILNAISSKILILEKEDAESALFQIGKLKIDYIFTDYQMPGMTGLDFAFALKERYPDQLIPMSLVTSWSERESNIFRELESKAKILGVQEILPKDLDQEDLKTRIRNIISLKL